MAGEMNPQAISVELTPVAVEMLRPRAVLEFDLFLRPSAASKPVLFRARDYPLEIDDFRSLGERGVRTLYIAAEQTAAYQRYLRECLARDRDVPLAAELPSVILRRYMTNLRGVACTGRN